MRRVFLAMIALVALTGALRAQTTDGTAQPAMLVADQVFVTPQRRLVAQGHVEVFHGDTRLRAERISYDQADGKLVIEGPIRLDQGGTVTILANSAELDRELQNGILRGARLVLNQQVQLAALQMTRVGGRYSQLYKTAVTSCRVCDDGRPPLWQIRARRITHDQAEQQLYFEDAQLRILDVPVLYFPGLRLPDPTLKRATGFLIPAIRSTSNLGTGIKVPYFIRIGDHKDLTLTAYLSSRTTTLEYRWRQAFRNGRIAFEGAHTRDDLIPGETRGYLFGTAHFDLRRGYQFDFSLQSASDNAYLVDYGLPDLDRLRTEIAFSRYKPSAGFRARLIHFDSLRDADDQSLLATVVFDTTLERRFFPDAIGGELRAALNLHAHHRTSDLDVVGRDLARGTLDVNWRRHWILRGGLRADWRMGVAADTFGVDQDSGYPARMNRITPSAALTLSLPMTRATRSATTFLEPVLQLGWSEVSGESPPNDESTFVEFDRGNLLALSRFPAPDRREDGPVLAYGVNWARYAANGWQASATVGQVLRSDADPDFTESSGLSGKTSDFLVAGQLRFGDTLALTARTLLDNVFSFSKAELRGDWTGNRASLAGTYLWLGADPVEGRTLAQSELWLDGGYKLGRGWSARANLRYDVSDRRATRAGLGLLYENECIALDLRVNRRYTSSTSIEPSTDFGFTIALSGFSLNNGQDKYRRSCS